MEAADRMRSAAFLCALPLGNPSGLTFQRKFGPAERSLSGLVPVSLPSSGRKDHTMWRPRVGWTMLLAGIALGVLARQAGTAGAACCYFAAKDADILQPAQKVFITWDPKEQVESFTVQPKFEGNARDFGMVIPTPSKPRLDEMPRDFF